MVLEQPSQKIEIIVPKSSSSTILECTFMQLVEYEIHTSKNAMLTHET